MIPRLARVCPTHDRYLAFLEAARERGFAGELESRYADRIVAATDNSIYQVVPQAVAYPRTVDDVAVLAALADEPRFHDIVLSARGGGTGTNGQSLSDGVMVDLSRHLNRILEIDPVRRIARVQAGVVKDQLEAALKPHGLFFAPELSTSNRATIGGMVATDASGQGSALYGKTRDHVLALRSVWLGGTVCDSRPMAAAELHAMVTRNDRVGALCGVAAAEVRAHREAIERRFPKLNRCLTGYDLAHVFDAAGSFDLNALLCGAEGTLAFVVEATLNLTPEPRCKALVTIGYSDFDAALRSARTLIAAKPASIETVDGTVLALAKQDIVWDGVREYFASDAAATVRGVNIVEFIADAPDELDRKIEELTGRLATGTAGAAGLGFRVVRDEAAIRRVWGMRKRAVGLLGNVAGERRPVPFVEDTAVPPEQLADYIAEFRAVLDREGLFYGMFGHVDAGVLHVRPALDLKDPEDELRIRRITDEVVRLTRKYHGLLWGEHGKGVRSEYSPEFFGDLYPSLQRIKAAADPRNQLNPGKIAAPPGHEPRMARIDGIPTRGQADRQVASVVRAQFPSAMTCNGNGACFNFDPDDAMCPSWKVTRDRIQSPKGRASVMRDWLRLMAEQGSDPRETVTGSWLERAHNTWRRRGGEYDFSHEVYVAMAGCLSCKSCATQCPVRVDVAELRSRFFDLYHSRYLRPARHYAVGWLEALLPFVSRVPRLYNAVAASSSGRGLTRRWFGLVDSPLLTGVDLARELKERGLCMAPGKNLPEGLQKGDRTVVVLQDAFTSFFGTPVVLATLDLLRLLGFDPLLAPFVANGKALHVHGFRSAFDRVAKRNADHLKSLTASGVPLIGIEPAVTLTYRQEYLASVGERGVPRVFLLQEWLAAQEDLLRKHAVPATGTYTLLAHCTERTNAGPSIADWQRVFAALGQKLDVPALGCCGMAGTFGHEHEHAEMSRQIYRQSWARVVAGVANRDQLLATGYSCRAQAKRVDGVVLDHPAQALATLLRRYVSTH